MSTTMSAQDKEFLAQCEEEFRDRFTEKDEEFMKVYTAEPSIPPIIETWWVSQNQGRRNDRRHNRRNHPYERHNRDDRRAGYDDEHANDDSGRSYHNYRPRHN